MRTVAEIKQDILALPEAEYSDLCRWVLDQDWERWEREFDEDVRAGRLDSLADEALETKEPLQQLTEGSAITPLEEWRLFPLKVAKRSGTELYDLEGFIHYSSSIGRLDARLALDSLGEAPKVRTTSQEERARQLIFALLDLHAKDCSIAGAILSDLRAGYLNAAWIHCRVMLESHILSRFLIRFNEEDAAERYNGSVSIQFATDNHSAGAKELYDEYAYYFPNAKKHGWASGIDGKTRWTTRTMAGAVNAKDLYTGIFKAESKYSHPDPSAYFGDIDEGLISSAWTALSELNPKRLYGQTDGPSIVAVAYEVTQYLSSATSSLMNVWPLTDKEILEEQYSHRSETVLKLLEAATHRSPFVRKVLGIQDEA